MRPNVIYNVFARGNYDAIVQALDSGLDINETVPYHGSLLMIAIEFNRSDIVHLLCERGARTDVAAYAAMLYGRAVIAAYLHSRGISFAGQILASVRSIDARVLPTLLSFEDVSKTEVQEAYEFGVSDYPGRHRSHQASCKEILEMLREKLLQWNVSPIAPLPQWSPGHVRSQLYYVNGDLLRMQEYMRLVPQSGHARPNQVARGQADLAPRQAANAQSAPTQAASRQAANAQSVPTQAAPEPSLTCVVCMGAPRSRLIMGCQHLCMCEECTNTVLKHNTPKCPICRNPFTETLKVYVS